MQAMSKNCCSYLGFNVTDTVIAVHSADVAAGSSSRC